MTEIAGLPFWEVRFDAEGHPDPEAEAALGAGVRERAVTDLILFAHGWNNTPDVATRLYNAFFGVLAGQLDQVPPDRPTRIGLAGIIWPSQRWSDEPIPDFTAPVAAVPGGGSASLGAASLGAASLGERPADGGAAVLSPELDPDTLALLEELFPAAVEPLDRMAELLTGPVTDDALADFYAQLKSFAVLAGAAGDDGEDDREHPGLDPAEPGMLLDSPVELFQRYTDTLQQTGAVLGGPGGQLGGEAGLGDLVGRAWHGAKEALRQLTYWEMKNRAGTVGLNGVGPMLGRLHELAPDLRIHLVGHSFGARLVSYTLAGLPAGLDPSPVKGVTLLQGAFSQWAFAPELPFDLGRGGALAGRLTRIDGPLVVVHSRHDDAVGTFYPLASIAAQDDSAGLGDAGSRWGGIGANGAQGAHAAEDAVRGAGPAARYPFAEHQAINIDASDVVRLGPPPVGAHSDIVHPELTWLVLSAGRIVA